MPHSRVRVRLPAWLHWPRRTARLRLTALYGGLFLLSGAALVAITYGLFERATAFRKPQLPKIPHDPALQRLEIPSPLVKTLGPLFQAQQQYLRAVTKLNKSLPAAGQTFTPGRHLILGPQLSQLAKDQRRLTQDQHQLTESVKQLASAVRQVSRAGTFEAAQRAADSHQLLVNSGIALGIVAVLALVAGWLLAGRMLRPLRTITRTAQRISSASLHERLALEGPQDELKELGDTLDDLFGRLDAAFAAQRHFVANASHELRTPLTAERNLLQVALDDPQASAASWRATAEELLASNDEQTHLIEALLALASSESGLEQRERIDLANVCRDVLARPGLCTGPIDVRVETDICPAPLDGDPTLVERLVANLVENATHHNVAGGHLQVSTDTVDGQAVLSVTNTGPIIPADQIDRLFQPFQRLDPRRTHHKNGHGLGLSIVQAIATTHHATITAEPLDEGGLGVTVTFPPPADRTDGAGPARPRRFATSDAT